MTKKRFNLNFFFLSTVVKKFYTIRGIVKLISQKIWLRNLSIEISKNLKTNLKIDIYIVSQISNLTVFLVKSHPTEWKKLSHILPKNEKLVRDRSMHMFDITKPEIQYASKIVQRRTISMFV